MIYECNLFRLKKVKPEDEDIVFHQKTIDMVVDDIIGIYQVPGKVHLIKVNKIEKSTKYDSLGIETQLWGQMGLIQNKGIKFKKYKIEDITLDVMDVIIKDQYFSRCDMYSFSNKMRYSVVSESKKLDYAGFRGAVGDLWCQARNVISGYIGKDTRVVYRSKSAVVHLFLQISYEMATFDYFGDRHFDKAVNFISDLFNKWNEYTCGHDVTIVLFSRIFAKTSNANAKSKLKKDRYGRYYEDFYSVVAQNERYMLSEWKKILKKLHNRYEEYIKELESFMTNLLGTNLDTVYELSSAYESNVLETLNITLNLYENYYTDRNFDRTGKICVVITAGSGVFRVDHTLTDMTKQRICDLGIGIDLVCVGEQPLHAVPLFIYETDNEEINIQDYYIPYWINHSFYRSEKEMQAIRENKFIQRINIKLLEQSEAQSSVRFENNRNLFVSRDFAFTKMIPGESTISKKRSFLMERENSTEILEQGLMTNTPMEGLEELLESMNLEDLSGESVSSSNKLSSKDNVNEKHVNINGNGAGSLSVNSSIISPMDQPRSSRIISTSSSWNNPHTNNPSTFEHNRSNYSVSSSLLSKSQSGNRNIGRIPPIITTPISNVTSSSANISTNIINPFKCGRINIRTTTNSRRWTHVFPVDFDNKPIQQHHKLAFDPSLPKKADENFKTTAVDSWALYNQAFFRDNPDFLERKAKRQKRQLDIREGRIPIYDPQGYDINPTSPTEHDTTSSQIINQPNTLPESSIQSAATIRSPSLPKSISTNNNSNKVVGVTSLSSVSSPLAINSGPVMNGHNESNTDTNLSEPNNYKLSPFIMPSKTVRSDKDEMGCNRNESNPINHMEHNPSQLIGVDWKSLTMPALLPITSDYYPDNQILENDFLENNYTLVGQNAESVDSIGQSKSALRNPLANDDIFREIINSRLNQDFQLVTKPPSCKPEILSDIKKPIDLEDLSVKPSPVKKLLKGKITKGGKSEVAGERKDNSEICVRFCIGRTYHSIIKQNDRITVNQYTHRKKSTPIDEICYRYCMRMPDSADYMEFQTQFSLQNNFNWNFHDNYILTYGCNIETDTTNKFQLQLNERFWRSRFLLIPTNSTTKQLMDSINKKLKPPCDVYEDITIIEQDNIVEEFFRFMELVNKFKRRIQNTKLSGGIQTACVLPQKTNRSISQIQPPTNHNSNNVRNGPRHSVTDSIGQHNHHQWQQQHTHNNHNNSNHALSPITTTPNEKLPRQFTFDTSELSNTNGSNSTLVDDPITDQTPPNQILRCMEDKEMGMSFLPPLDCSTFQTTNTMPLHTSVSTHPIFTGHTCVHWCLNNIRQIQSIKEACKFLERFVTSRDFVNINSTAANKKFLYGFVMYSFTCQNAPQPQAIGQQGKKMMTHGTSASFDNLTTCDNYDMSTRVKRGVFEWAEVMLSVPTINDLPVSKWVDKYVNKYGNKYNWTIQNKPSLTDFPKFEFLLDELPIRRLTDMLNPSNFEMFTGKIPGDNNVVFENGVMSRKVMLDIDNSDEKRSEWGLFQHEANYHPTSAFEFTILWLVATGIRLNEKINAWTRRLSNLQLIPVPVDPFALPSSINSDPLRGPIFVPLKLSHLIHPNFDDTCVIGAMNTLFKDYEIKERKYRLLLFQEMILKRFGFVRSNCVTFTTSDYDSLLEEKSGQVFEKETNNNEISNGHRDPSSHKMSELEPNRRKQWSYVHCSGGMFVMIPNYPELVVVNQTDKSSENIGFSREDMWTEPGFLWSWNKMLPKKLQKVNILADEAFQDHMLANFRDFCNGGDQDTRLKKLFEDAQSRTKKVM